MVRDCLLCSSGGIYGLQVHEWVITDLEKLSDPVRSRIAVALQTSMSSASVSLCMIVLNIYVAELIWRFSQSNDTCKRSNQDT